MNIAHKLKQSLLLLLICLTTGGAMVSCRPATPYSPEGTSASTETAAPVNPTETEGADTIAETESISEETEGTETDSPETEAPILVEEIVLSFHSLSLGIGTSVTPKITVAPLEAENQRIIPATSDASVAIVDENGTVAAVGKGSCTVTFTAEGNPVVKAEITVEVNESPCAVYIDGVLIANKTYALPSDYAPGIDAEAYDRLLTMINDAANQGISLWLISGYRSYWDQNTIYNNYVARDGQAAADRYSARPGHSEHQTGLAFDLNSLYQSFGDTEEGIWLAENCHRYGFIIRYPREKEHITGYMYEPWHVRYVGREMAQRITESGLCVEEFFGISSAY